MACSLKFTCDYCGEEVSEHPLAGHHTEVRVRVSYPRGWSFDSDGDAMCPSCTAKDSTSAQERAEQEAGEHLQSLEDALQSKGGEAGA